MEEKSDEKSNKTIVAQNFINVTGDGDITFAGRDIKGQKEQTEKNKADVSSPSENASIKLTSAKIDLKIKLLTLIITSLALISGVIGLYSLLFQKKLPAVSHPEFPNAATIKEKNTTLDLNMMKNILKQTYGSHQARFNPEWAIKEFEKRNINNPLRKEWILSNRSFASYLDQHEEQIRNIVVEHAKSILFPKEWERLTKADKNDLVEFLTPIFLYRLGKYHHDLGNKTKAKKYYASASQRDVAIAKFKLGQLIEDDETEKVRLYEEAADRHVAEAALELIAYYESRLAESPENYKRFLLAFMKAKNAGVEKNLQIYHRLLKAHNLYNEGLGYVLSREKNSAIRKLKQASDMGHIHAQYRLGQLYYEEGKYKEARVYFLSAGEAGHKKSLCKLLGMHKNKLIIERDPPKLRKFMNGCDAQES